MKSSVPLLCDNIATPIDLGQFRDLVAGEYNFGIEAHILYASDSIPHMRCECIVYEVNI